MGSPLVGNASNELSLLSHHSLLIHLLFFLLLHLRPLLHMRIHPVQSRFVVQTQTDCPLSLRLSNLRTFFLASKSSRDSLPTQIPSLETDGRTTRTTTRTATTTTGRTTKNRLIKHLSSNPIILLLLLFFLLEHLDHLLSRSDGVVVLLRRRRRRRRPLLLPLRSDAADDAYRHSQSRAGASQLIGRRRRR